MIAGAIGGDLRTTGEYVVTIQGAHMLTHLGPIPFPTGESFGLLFPKQTTRGPWKFAGKAHDGKEGETWEWDAGVWTPHPPANGENGFAYTADGTLHIIAPGKDVTSQGYRRNGDASLSMGDMVYGPWHGISEYAEIGDGLYIGQGDPQHGTVDGVVLWDVQRDVNLILALGYCTFITVDRVGDAVALSYCTPQGVEFVQTTMTALRDLPTIPKVVLPPPAPIPAPVPQPKPEPIPMPTLPQAVKASRDRYVAQYPIPRGPSPSDDAFENICRGWILGLAEQVRFDTNDASWGVKNAGGGRPQSKDSLAQNGPRLINFDLLTGVGTGHPTLVADPQGEDITGQVFMPVAAINHLGNATEPPVQPPANPPPVPSVDLGPLTEKLAANARRIDALEAVIGALTASVEALKQPKRYRVVGSTGRTYGHAHNLDVRLEEIQ